MANATRVLSAVKYGYIRSDNPNTHYTVNTGSFYSLNVYRTYMLMQFAAMPSSLRHKKLISAAITAQVRTDYDDSPTSYNLLRVHHANDFNANTVTYNTRPNIFSTANSSDDIYKSSAPKNVSISSNLDDGWLDLFFRLDTRTVAFDSFFTEFTGSALAISPVLSGGNSPARVTVTYDDAVNVLSKVTPVSYPTGTVHAHFARTFSWKLEKADSSIYCADETWTQASATLYWKKSTASSYTAVNVSGSSTQVTVPANTFPTGSTVQWYIRATDTDGTTTQTEVKTFYTYATQVTPVIYPSGNNVDNRVAQRFTWNYTTESGDTGTPQRSAKLYWRVSGAGSWHVLNIAGSTKAIDVPAYTFPADSTIEVEIEGTDYSGATSTSETLTFKTLAYTLAISSAPTGSNIDTRNAITFSWTISNAQGAVNQSSAVFYWRVSGASSYTAVNISGGTKSVSTPANTFPTGKTIQWYVRVTAADGTVLQSSAATFNTVSTKVTLDTYPSGNDVYTAAVLRWTWHLASNVGNYSQASAKLYWRVSTSSTYTAINVSGNTQALNVAANTFPTNKTIQWYVEATDVGGLTSTTSVMSFKTVTTQITPQSSPTSGYINPRTAQKFQWYFKATGGAVPQGSATFYWRVKGASSWTSIAASGTTTSVTVPSNTFPVASYIEWYVAGTDTGGYSSTSDTYELSTTAEMAYAYPQSPVNGMIDGSQPATFTWIAETADGAPINSIHLRYRAAGAQAWTTLGFLGTDRSYTFPADTFDPGIIKWQTNATNIDVIDGPWAGATFICMIAPKVTGLNATAVPWSTIRWQANDQQCYQIEIDGTVSGPYFGTEREFTLPDYLRDGVHTIRLRVKGSMDLWSTWAETTVAIENVPETALTLTAEADTDTELAWETASATEDFYVYRDDKMIAHTRNKAFVDRLALGRHEYHVVNRLASGHYDRSETAVTTTHVQHLSLAGIDGGEWAQIVHTLKSAKDPEIKETMSVSYTHFAGRARPDAMASEFIDTPIVCSAVFLPNEQQALRTMRGLFGKTVIAKMIDGSCRVCFLDSWTFHAREHYYTAFTFTLQQIEWEDFIDDTA